MSDTLLVVRPEPGNAATAQLARAAGFAVVAAPLFDIRPVPWRSLPADRYAALVIASASVLRQGGPALAAYRSLPVYAVGQTTARLARDAGFDVVRTGSGGIAALLAGVPGGRLLRLAGRDRVALDDAGIAIDTVVVYEAVPVPLSDAAVDTIAEGAVVLLHSAAAARHFRSECARRKLAPEQIRLAVFSAAVSDAAGNGWASVAVSAAPDDAALLSSVKSRATCDGDARSFRPSGATR